MVNAVAFAFVGIFFVSLISLIGILFFYNYQIFSKKFLMLIVAFSAGTLLGTSFFDLIPESFESGIGTSPIILGIILFYLMELSFNWHHVHKDTCKDCVAPVAYLNLIGDFMHNMLDGVIIMAAFVIDIRAGVIATFSIAMHEIPQEIGDFGVLLHGGLKWKKALLFNFLVSLSSIFGGILFLLSSKYIYGLAPYILAFSAGGFIYISTADIFPELHKEKNKKKMLLEFLFVIIGIVIIKAMLSIFKV